MSLAITTAEHAAFCNEPGALCDHSTDHCWHAAMQRVLARESPFAGLKALIASCAAHADKGEPDEGRRIWTAAVPMLLHSIQQLYSIGPNAAPGLSTLLQAMGAAADLAE